jgi:UrcA family protein
MKNSKWVGSLIVSTAAAVALAAPSLCLADGVSKSVRYEAGSLGNAEGIHTLYRRLLNAANVVCTNTHADKDISGRSQKCAASALADAVRQVNSPALSRAYIAANGAENASRYGIEPVLRTANN